MISPGEDEKRERRGKRGKRPSLRHQSFPNKIEKYREEEPRLTQQDFAIRQATMDDLEGIFSVEETAFLAGDRYSRALFISHLAPPYHHAFERRYFVAVAKAANAESILTNRPDPGKIIGYAEVAIQTPEDSLFYNTAPAKNIAGSLSERVGTLISSGVYPEFQGIGIGSGLLEARLEYLEKKNINLVFAHAWPNGGFPRLAERFGFERIIGWSGGRIYSDGTRPQLYYKRLTSATTGITYQKSKHKDSEALRPGKGLR